MGRNLSEAFFQQSRNFFELTANLVKLRIANTKLGDLRQILRKLTGQVLSHFRTNSAFCFACALTA